MENLIDVLKRIIGEGEITVFEVVYALKNSKDLKVYAHSKHRWYTTYKRVVKIGDIFVEFRDYECHSDEALFNEDEEVKMVINSMKQVFPKEVTIIDYVEKKD